MARAKKEEDKHVTVVTPIGILSFPFLVKPDIGRQNSSLKFSGELFVPKSVFTTEGKDMIAAVTNVAREFHGDKKLQLKDIQSPFKDMDTEKDAEEWQKGTIRIRAKAGKKDMTEADWNRYRPTVIAPRKNEKGEFPRLSPEEVAAIKGGDECRFICSVYGYSQQGGGVALGLNFVQFAKAGKALGQGKMKQVEALGEIEVGIDLPEVESATEADDADPMMSFA